MAKPERIELTSHLQWVRLDAMKINPQAQRSYDKAWAQTLAKDFNPDLMGFIHVSKRDGWYYVVDGQHRREAAIMWLGSDQQVQCHVYEDLTSEREAQLFLDLNKKKNQTPLGRYKVALTANRDPETDINRIVTCLGLVVGSSADLEEISCVTALINTYTKSGPGSLSFSLRTIRDAYGHDGFKQDIIGGLALIKDRYGTGLDEDRLVARLNRKGIVELRRRTKQLKETTGNPLAQCVACAAIEFYNAGRGPGVAPWWNFKVVTSVGGAA